MVVIFVSLHLTKSLFLFGRIIKNFWRIDRMAIVRINSWKHATKGSKKVEPNIKIAQAHQKNIP